MMRILVTVVAIAVGAGAPQDAARTADLVKKLDAEDWVEQAQAAKELVKLGPPILPALKAAVDSDSPAAKFWASQISQAIMQKVPSPTEPLPVNPEPVAVPNPKGFAPGPNDMGALVFICNNSAHGPYEATFSRCVSCAKTKRFAYDYGADCYRCAVCKRAYTRKEILCDRCGQPPAGRIPIRMKTAGGL
jgi:hypothetical protein